MSRLTVYPTLDEYERRLPDMAQRLAGINADKLKKMARVWVGKDAYKLNKESAIQTLKRSFRDPEAIRQLRRPSNSMQTSTRCERSPIIE